MSDQTLDPAWSLADEVRVAPGATFAFVSGLGGKSVRARCNTATRWTLGRCGGGLSAGLAMPAGRGGP